MIVNEQEICALYTDQNRSLAAVAKQAKTSVYLVRRILDRNGIKIRLPGKLRASVADPNTLVHLGVKISKSDRDALEAGAGKSANVREAIRGWKDRDQDVLSFTREELMQVIDCMTGSWPSESLKQKMYSFLGKK